MIGTIHIAGVMPRIGTTTLCMQLVTFLQANEYNACYVEKSRQDYIWGITQIYEGVKTDRTGGRTIYLDIAMYGRERLDALLKGVPEDYDFIVCDFGNMMDPSFDAAAFAGGDCVVAVCGNKANEVFRTEDMLADSMYAEAIPVFNFTEPSDYQAIQGMMGTRAKETLFMSYIPDPFSRQQDYTKNEFFQSLMDIAMSRIHGA